MILATDAIEHQCFGDSEPVHCLEQVPCRVRVSAPNLEVPANRADGVE